MKSKRWISKDKLDKIRPGRRKDFRATDPEKNRRRMQEGRTMEQRVGDILTNKMSSGLFVEFTLHKPNSPEDCNGHDVTVVMPNGRRVSFGITTSFRAYKQYFQKHPGQNCLYMPFSCSDEEVWDQIQRFLSQVAVE